MLLTTASGAEEERKETAARIRVENRPNPFTSKKKQKLEVKKEVDDVIAKPPVVVAAVAAAEQLQYDAPPPPLLLANDDKADDGVREANIHLQRKIARIEYLKGVKLTWKEVEDRVSLGYLCVAYKNFFSEIETVPYRVQIGKSIDSIGSPPACKFITIIAADGQFLLREVCSLEGCLKVRSSSRLCAMHLKLQNA